MGPGNAQRVRDICNVQSDGGGTRRLHQFMLTFKDYKPIIDKDNCKIGIWNDDKNEYEWHSFEFIEELYSLITE
jgi:hypothetical protein